MTEPRSKQRYDWRQRLMRTKSSKEASELRALIAQSLREEAEAIAALDAKRAGKPKAALDTRSKACPSPLRIEGETQSHIPDYLSSKY